jgi:hypothetical protein
MDFWESILGQQAVAQRVSAIARQAAAATPTALAVDGHHYPSGTIDCAFTLSSGSIFTAEADAVEQQLPAGLRPARLRRGGRALVAVTATDWQWRLDGMPPIRSADIMVSAIVTSTDRPEPPAWKMFLGAARPGARYGFGVHWLTWLTTNPVSAGAFSHILGVATALVDVREVRQPQRTTFTAADDGRPVLELDVAVGLESKRNADPPATGGPSLECYRGYGARGGRLAGWSVTCVDVGGAQRMGRGAARLAIGDHPAVASLAPLQLSERSITAMNRDSGREVYEGPVPLRSAAVMREVPRPTQQQRRFTLRIGTGAEEAVDQFPAGLPFDPGAAMTLESVG